MQGVYAAILLQPGKKKGAHRLYEDQVEPALVRRHGGNASALLVDLVPRELAAAGIDIDVGEREPALTLPEEANRPEEEDDGEGKVRHEEALGIVEAAGDGADGNEELGDEDEEDEEETEVGAVDTTDSLEGNLVSGVSVVGPGRAEADVGQADAAPSEEGGKTGKGEEPVEDGRAITGETNVGKGTEDEHGEDGEEGAVGAVDVVEDLGGITLLGKSGKGTRATEDTGDTDRQNGDKNDDVHERIEALEVGVLADEDKGRGVDVDHGVGTEQVLIVVGDKKTDEEETEDVEEGDTPEHLLDGTGKRLEGVASLSGGKTDKLSTGEREGGSDEAGAEATETVGKSTRLVPVTRTPVLVVAGAGGATTEDKDEADDDEDNSRSQLEDRRVELLLSISECTEDVDDDDGEEEDGDPDT